MKPMREVVTERIGRAVVASYLLEVSEEEIDVAKTSYQKTGNCDHSIVSDEPGWMYDIRSCYICGEGLGTV